MKKSTHPLIALAKATIICLLCTALSLVTIHFLATYAIISSIVIGASMTAAITYKWK